MILCFDKLGQGYKPRKGNTEHIDVFPSTMQLPTSSTPASMDTVLKTKKSKSSRSAINKVLRWLEHNISPDVHNECCWKKNVATNLNNTISNFYPEEPLSTPPYSRFHRDSKRKRMFRKFSRVQPLDSPIKKSTTLNLAEAHAVVSVSSAHELKTFLKNGYKCTLC